jgi:hypothetical protein
MGSRNVTTPSRLRRNVGAGDQVSAREWRALVDMITRSHGVYPIKVTGTMTGGLKVELIGTLVDDWEVHGFRWIDRETGIIQIRERTIRIHQIRNVQIEEAEMHLAGNPAFVVASLLRGSNYLLDAVRILSSEPSSNATHLNIPLFKFSLDTETGRYSLASSSRFDVNIDAPTI